jgi:hypothetical protein
MALLTAQDVDTDGLLITTVAAGAAGDTFGNPQERYQFHVVSSAGVQRTVTIASTGLCNHGFPHDIVQTIEDGETWTFGPFDRERFNDATGIVTATYDVETGLAVAVLNSIKPPQR